MRAHAGNAQRATLHRGSSSDGRRPGHEHDHGNPDRPGPARCGGVRRGPNVVAMAADHHGPIYEGAAGPRVAGGSDTVTPDTMFRIASMTKMVATDRGAAARRGRQARPRRAGRELPPGVRRICRCSRASTATTPRLRAPKTKATVRQLTAHTSGLAYWFWNEDIVRWEAGDGHAQRALGRRGDLHRAAGRRPGHDLRVRHQHRLARPRRRGGEATRSTPTSPSASSSRWAWSTRRSR